MPILYLTCGLPGSGKTSFAKVIEQEVPALRLTGDDWMLRLYPGISTQEAELGPCRGRVEQMQWRIALQVLRLGCSVVVDWGVWARAERDVCRQEARAAGARVVLCFLDVPFDKLWERVAQRNAMRPADTFEISRTDLARWCSLFEPPTTEELALYDPLDIPLSPHPDLR